MAEKLQIICFKMDSPSLIRIDDLIKDQLYFSRSEVLRVAIRLLLMKLSSNDSSFSMSSLGWNSIAPEYAPVNKDSVSSKLPPILLKCVDEAVNHGLFQSRSHFIRESIKLFLEEREALHNYVQNESAS